MKTLFSILAALLALTLNAPMANAAGTTCKVKTADIGTIVGRGRSPSAAFEDAATQCFERRAQMFRKVKKADLGSDVEAGLTVIDVCANISCEG